LRQRLGAKNTHIVHQKASNNKCKLSDIDNLNGRQSNGNGSCREERRFVLIDVREADEIIEDSKIEGAVNMPLGQLIRKARQGALDDLKGKVICTYRLLCRFYNCKLYPLSKLQHHTIPCSKTPFVT
jgi:hypothetical protein